MACCITSRMAARAIGGVSLGILLSACGAKTPPPMPAPPPPPAPTVRILFEDNFAGYNQAWRQVHGQWAVTNGRMTQTRDDARERNAILFYDPVIISDAEITADTMMLAEMPRFTTGDDEELFRTKRRIAGSGIVFRYQDENDFYMFRLAGEDGLVLGKMVRGQWTDLINPRAADFSGARLHTDTLYQLRVRVVGDRIQCWINDKAVANLEDASLPTGHFGLATFNSRAAFTSLLVTEK